MKMHDVDRNCEAEVALCSRVYEDPVVVRPQELSGEHITAHHEENTDREESSVQDPEWAVVEPGVDAGMDRMVSSYRSVGEELECQMRKYDGQRGDPAQTFQAKNFWILLRRFHDFFVRREEGAKGPITSIRANECAEYTVGQRMASGSEIRPPNTTRPCDGVFLRTCAAIPATRHGDCLSGLP